MLKRTLGTRDITLFAIACIIGTRWIPAAAHAGPGAILLWILGALGLSVPLAIAVAALTVRHPTAGGMYIWTKHDFGPLHGFLCFWLYWMGIVIWFPGAAMFYVSAMSLPALHDRTWLVVVALAAIWVALGANMRGVKTGQRTADLGAASSWTIAASRSLSRRLSSCIITRFGDFVPSDSGLQLGDRQLLVRNRIRAEWDGTRRDDGR